MFLFIDYFKMQGSQTADETHVFAGLIIIFVPTVILWLIDYAIYSQFYRPSKNQYITVLSNGHFVSLFILNYFIGGVCQFLGFTLAGNDLMILTFCFFNIAIIANLYMLFFIKKSTLLKTG